MTLNSVTYTVTGNGFTKTGAIDTSGSPTVSGTIGGIPAGKGYTITLTATSVEGDTTFTGSAKFDVTAGATTSVTLRLNGAGKTGNGSVAVNGTINVNPRIDEVTVTPQTVFVGGSIKLLAVGSDPDAGPSPLSYYWSTTGGVIDNPIGPSATLTSATPGTFTIKLTLSDGDATDTATTTVTFVRPSAGGGAGGGGGAAGGGGGSGGAVAGPSKPNILLIIADDLGAEATSLYPDLGGTRGQVSIPNIEALAQQRRRVRQRLGEPGVLADPRHHRQRPVRLSHRRDDRGQRAADLDRHALRPPHGRQPQPTRTPSSGSTISVVEASIPARAPRSRPSRRFSSTPVTWESRPSAGSSVAGSSTTSTGRRTTSTGPRSPTPRTRRPS